MLSRTAYFLPALGLSLALLLPGCGRNGNPAGNAPAGPGAAQTQSGEPTVADVSQIDVSASTEFRIRAEKRSLAVVEHFNDRLAERGWKKVRPKLIELPGHRKWLATGSPIGPTEAYDAAWEHPETGQSAVLNIWHTAEHPELQYGTFEIFAKEEQRM